MSATNSGSVTPDEGVLVSETGVERLQLVARASGAAFLLGGLAVHGGRTSGPNPYDLLAASLASCTAMTLRLYAERSKVPLGRVQVNVSFHRDAPGHRGRFERAIAVEGFLDSAQRELLLSVADRCPAGLVLGQGAEIRTVLMEEDALAPLRPGAAPYDNDVQAAAATEQTELRHAAAGLGLSD